MNHEIVTFTMRQLVRLMFSTTTSQQPPRITDHRQGLVVKIDFNGDNIVAFEEDDKIYVSVQQA